MDISNNVITKAYEVLNNNAISLQTSVAGLSVGNESSLAAVKEAWRTTRSSWEQSGAFSYGPVGEGLDRAIDSWPVDIDSVNVILNIPLPISVDTIKASSTTRGFHVIEYLVWGSDGQKTASDLTVKELEYLTAAATDLQNNTHLLFNGWAPLGGNFTGIFISAGNNAIYPLQKDALLEMTDGMIALAEEVALFKIGNPLGDGVLLEESRLSNNTKQDLADNMQSIRNIYLGDLAATDLKGLTNLVESDNIVLDTEIKAKIDIAIQAIDAIPNTFSQSLADNRPAIENALAQIVALQTILQNELKPFFEQFRT